MRSTRIVPLIKCDRNCPSGALALALTAVVWSCVLVCGGCHENPDTTDVSHKDLSISAFTYIDSAGPDGVVTLFAVSESGDMTLVINEYTNPLGVLLPESFNGSGESVSVPANLTSDQIEELLRSVGEVITFEESREFRRKNVADGWQVSICVRRTNGDVIRVVWDNWESPVAERLNEIINEQVRLHAARARGAQPDSFVALTYRQVETMVKNADCGGEPG